MAFGSFLAGVSRYSVPSRVRLDAGVENGLIRNFMVTANGPDRGSALTGKSVHNQRIEALEGRLQQSSPSILSDFPCPRGQSGSGPRKSYSYLLPTTCVSASDQC